MRIRFHILAGEPIPPLHPALAKALFCPYVELCRASMILQDTAILSITCHEQTTAYCTYGRLLSVAMENYTDGPSPDRLTSFSGRLKEWRPLVSVNTWRPCKRSHAWIREQWHSHVHAQAESGLSARECFCGSGFNAPRSKLLRHLSYLLTGPCEKSIGYRPAAGYPHIHCYSQKKKNQKGDSYDDYDLLRH